MSTANHIGAVIYTDGGSKPNPGFIGWGMHGYKYTTEVSKQGTGLTNHVTTDKGYFFAKDAHKQRKVTPIVYYDFLGSSSTLGTNNEAELKALISSLTKLLEEDITTLRVYTDSDYLVRGIKEGLDKWSKQNWRRQTGEIIPNYQLWQQIQTLLELYKTKNIEVSVKWVKGHSDNLGNELADKLASIAVNYSINKKEINDYKTTTAKGYWKREVDKHPFINHKRLYFNTANHNNIPGSYFLAEPGGDDTIIGKKIPDSGYCVIRLKEPDPIIEIIKNYQDSIAGDLNNIAVMRLDKLYRADTYFTILDHGGQALCKASKYNPAVNFIDSQPITVLQNPPGLCLRAIQCSSILEEILDLYESVKHHQPTIYEWTNRKFHNVTNIFYTKTTLNKNNMIVKELDNTFGVGFKNLTLSLPVEYDNSTIELNIPLTLGLDLPARNNLKRLEQLDPTITVMTWQEGPRCFRYTTIVEISNAIGVWANYHANQIYVK